MALDSLQIVTVYVTDLDGAVTFYTEKLGLEKRADMPFGDGQRWLTVAPRGAETEIALQPAEPGRPGGFTGIVFGSDDPEATAATWRRAGSSSPSGPSGRSGGR